MAIQDNTDYTLKGKQVKKIVQEIKESGITYSAGTGLELTGTTFSVDNTIATKSEIPTVNNATLTIQKNSTTAGAFTANSATDTTINITVPVTAADVSALPASTKYAANLSLTIDSSTYVVTGQLKDQDGNNLGSAQTIDLPLESVVVSGSYDSTNKKIVLTLQSGQTIDVPIGDLVSGLQTEITSSNKLSADLVDDSTTANKFVTASDKTTWSGKQNALTAGSNITISGDIISATDTTYTAGTGLSLSGTEFSVDTSTVQSKLTAGSNITIAGDTISATDTTYSDFVGATSGDAGTHGLVPAPASGDTDKYLKSDGSWATVSQYSLPAATASTLGGVKIGSNLSMDANDVLSATDTTYSNFVGTDGTAAGTAGLVPAPATTDAGKVLSASGAWTGLPEGGKTLTTADYNWPTTGTKTGVAVWLLNEGIYKIGEASLNINFYASSSLALPLNQIIIVSKKDTDTVSLRLANGLQYYRTNNSGGTLSAPGVDGFSVVLSSQIIDNLTSTAARQPLSAAQGKYLNDNKADKTAFTGATASTAGTAGLVPAPAAGDESKVLKGDGTWAIPEGGIKTLTTADYNWNSSTGSSGTPNMVYFMKMPTGVYQIEQGVSASAGYDQGVDIQLANTWIKQGDIIIVRQPETGSLDNNVYVTKIAGPIIRSYYSAPSNSTLRTTLQYNVSIVDSVATYLNTELTKVSPLSAYQGRLLDQKIEGRIKTNAGAPTTSTAGTKGQLLEDTTNGNLYICTNSASPYAWKQIDKDEILTNAGAPTTSTVGTLGQLLTDTTNAKLYQLTAIDTTDPQNPSYTWTEVGGSSGPTVVQTTGTSTTDVMSQNAVTSMVFNDPSTKQKVQIGLSSNALGNYGIAIGMGSGVASSKSSTMAIGVNASGGGTSSIAIGDHASTTAMGSVSIGSYSSTSSIGEVNIGTSETVYGYNSSNYRLLTGLYDPQSAHDAATKGYVDSVAPIMEITDTDPGADTPTTANTITFVYS